MIKTQIQPSLRGDVSHGKIQMLEKENLFHRSLRWSSLWGGEKRARKQRVLIPKAFLKGILCPPAWPAAQVWP